MLVVISPAKRLDMTPASDVARSQPDHQDAANELAAYARKLSKAKLKSMMGLSDALAQLNVDRFKAFEECSTPENAKQAALIFAGDTYQGLEAKSLDAEDLAWAQDHLRILSGLYGVLRPLDLIQPYRLEMGSRLKTKRGKNLYDYWGDHISRALNAAAAANSSDALINCASTEYFSAVDRAVLSPNVITPVFMEERDGAAKIVSFFAKKARGAMARFIIENRISDPDQIKHFEMGGYRFDADKSEGSSWVFLRDYPEPVAAKRKA